MHKFSRILLTFPLFPCLSSKWGCYAFSFTVGLLCFFVHCVRKESGKPNILLCWMTIVEAQKVIKGGGNRKRISLYSYYLWKWGTKGGRRHLFDIMAKGVGAYRLNCMGSLIGSYAISNFLTAFWCLLWSNSRSDAWQWQNYLLILQLPELNTQFPQLHGIFLFTIISF